MHSTLVVRRSVRLITLDNYPQVLSVLVIVPILF